MNENVDGKPTIGSLFAGIGGIDLAFEWAGWRTAWQVEIDPYCRTVLSRHWPNVPKYEDVRTVGQHNLTPVDCLVGGFPCQDISAAGRGAGIKDGTRSGLWYEYARIIGELRPRLVLLENVSAILARDGDLVVGSLAEMGYDARWGIIRASDVGAPHQRARWFCVAYCNKQGLAKRIGVSTDHEQERATIERVCNGMAYAARTDGNDINQKGRTPPQFRRGSSRNSRPGQDTSQPQLGRAVDGLPARLDTAQWPAPPGSQFSYEPDRTTTVSTNRAARLRALGNAVVPDVVYPIALMLRAEMEREDE